MPAYKDDIRDRIRRINPKALHFMDSVEAQLREKGVDCSGMVITTEDMTPQEEEMAFIEGYLKQGVKIDEAEKMALKKLKKLKSLGL